MEDQVIPRKQDKEYTLFFTYFTNFCNETITWSPIKYTATFVNKICFNDNIMHSNDKWNSCRKLPIFML